MTSIFKVGDQTIRPGRAWRDSNGTLQPKNWNIWSEDEKKAAGISEVVMQPFPDQRLYSSSHNADGSVNSTANSLTDVNQVDEDGKIILDRNGNQLVTLGVKSNLKSDVKRQQASLLAQTDWAIVRKADKGTAVPSNIQTWRDAIRTKATEMETAIDNAANTDAVEALFVKWTTDSDGKTTKSGILYDWPELGS
tara:strand:+ start:1872 stop:2453 length:582 start_codon:yes stop_codon:yes gene_type:complete